MEEALTSVIAIISFVAIGGMPFWFAFWCRNLARKKNLDADAWRLWGFLFGLIAYLNLWAKPVNPASFELRDESKIGEKCKRCGAEVLVGQSDCPKCFEPI